VDNLGLTSSEEADPVNFLKILTDGYTKPDPVTPRVARQGLWLDDSG
jgi:hypothetical protein